MATFDIILVAVVVCSVAFFLILLNRIFAYNRTYKFPETKYTKMFGVLTKEHVLMAYAVVVILHLLIGVWFAFKI